MQQSRDKTITAGDQTSAGEPQRPLSEIKVGELTADKKRLVEVPYTATMAHTMNALVANNVVAVPVAAPPGKWIGAGGSMIMESDKQTGVVRKHYIGMVTMLDILSHIAGDRLCDDSISDLEQKMASPVSSIIGHCLEGLSLWTLNPNTSLLDCMEVFSKGIHRALVPVDSHMENISGVELIESASSYRMLTQMDVLRFLKEYESSELEGIVSKSVYDLAVVNDSVYAITENMKLIDAIKCMKIALLNAVPIVESSDSMYADNDQLVNGRYRKPVGTFSATDLRGCHLAALQTWLPLSAFEFTQTVGKSALFASDSEPKERELVTCVSSSTLAEVMDKAVSKHVHRVWVVDHEGLLIGIVSLTDIIKVVRSALLSKNTTS